jgi:copper homeostasis protein
VTVLVEACVDSIESALAAMRGGAQRLELCANLDVGGTTPTTALIEEARDRTGLPVMVMVRPRGGSYVHTDEEVDRMRRDIDAARRANAAGVVFGLLRPDDHVDAERTRVLVEHAAGMPATFHMAFDKTPDRGEALQTLIDAGVSRVLTSGGAPTALDGAAALAELVALAGNRIVILAGKKVRGDTVSELVRRSGVREVHARSPADEAQIKAIVDALRSGY